MMCLPKLFAHASLILRMFAKMTFIGLFLFRLVMVPNLVSLCSCPSKKQKKINNNDKKKDTRFMEKVHRPQKILQKNLFAT